MAISWLATTDAIYSLYIKLLKRHLAAEGGTFPYANQEWARGTIQAVTSSDDDADCTLTLRASGDAPFGDDEFFNRYGAGPAFFRINILLFNEADISTYDPRKVVTLGVTGMAPGTTGDATHLRGITADPIYDVKVKGQILDKDDLVGKTWRIIGNNGDAGGQHFLERWPEPPRERTRFLGSVTSAGDVFKITFSSGLTPVLTGSTELGCRIWFTASDTSNSIVLTLGGQDGDFHLAYLAESTAVIDFDATASEIQAALNALSSISAGGGSVTVEFVKQTIRVNHITTVFSFDQPSTTLRIATEKTRFTEDQWAGFDVMYRDCTGRTRRTKLTGNTTGDTGDPELEFDTLDWRARALAFTDQQQPGDPWPTANTIHFTRTANPATNQGFWHDSADARMSLWYRPGGHAMISVPSKDALTGGVNNFACLVPNPSIDVTKWGIIDEVWESFTDTISPTLHVDVWNKDIDYGTEYTGGPGVGKNDLDKCYTPNFAKTIADVQVDAIGLSFEFVPPGYSGGIDPPRTWGEIMDEDPDLPNALDAAGLDHDLGPRRKFPHRGRNPFFAKTMYRPSDGGPLTPANDITGMDPQEQTGYYDTMPAETHFAEYGDDGAMPGIFTAAAGDKAVANDILTRYVGHGQFDPIDLNGDDYDGFILHFINANKGPLQTTDYYKFSRSGSITSFGLNWIVDDHQDWHPNPPLIEHSGTAAGGGSTSLTFDGAFAASSFNSHADRGRWVNAAADCPHWIEVNSAVDGSGYWTARPITSHTEGGAIGMNDIGFSASDKPWRIREPYSSGTPADEPLNPLKGRWAIFISPDGETTYAVKIKYSHKKMLWLDSSLPGDVNNSWRYEIADNQFGEVFRLGGTYWRKSGVWRKPSGGDPRTNAHGMTFPDDESLIPPLCRHDKFGIWIKGDYLGDWIEDDMNALLAVMLDTKRGYDFVSKGEENFAGGGHVSTWDYFAPGYATPEYDDSWNSKIALADSFWPSATGSSPGDPFLSKEVFVWDNEAAGAYGNVGDIHTVQTVRKYAYPHITGFTTLLLPSAVDFYARSVIAVDDPDEGVSSDWYHRLEAHFDPQGTALVFREYALIAALGASEAAERWGPAVGPSDITTLPTYTKPADPLPHSTADDHDHRASISIKSGFLLTNKDAVLHWSF